ncbi:hypothetical protein H1P_1570011 [Hyella patelloides LEGE 07179]|uniref:Uncharacterized protein n=1 Tax=Hyella patelloides LEGE 07179 TaxID=945734 RepID=A0A563VME8_9CYAN|nr:hypothetical protein H1P_1570011 [Hyella patelloides LEGE 07179]
MPESLNYTYYIIILYSISDWLLVVTISPDYLLSNYFFLHPSYFKSSDENTHICKFIS